MNAKQNRILSLYQKSCPNQTLREMSQEFGINISRIFRLINGYEMKISEYEKIESVLRKKEINNPNLFELAKKCQQSLSSEKITRLMEEMQLQLYCKHPEIVKEYLPEGA